MKLLGYIISKKKATLFVLDVIIIAGACLLANFLRLGWVSGKLYIQGNILPFVLTGIIFLILFYIADLYDFKKDFHSLNQIAGIVLTCGIAFVISAFLIYTFWLWLPGRGVFALYWGCITAGIILWRYLYTYLVRHPAFKTKVIIIGTSNLQVSLASEIVKEKKLGVELVGFVSYNSFVDRDEISAFPILGKIDNLEEIIKKYQIDEVIIENKYQVDDNTKNILSRCFIEGVRILDIPEFYGENWHKVPLLRTSKEWLYQELTKAPHTISYEQNLKRLLDLILSGIGLLLFFPLFILIAIAIKVDSKGRVFYRQERLGKGMRSFRIIKFRTMIEGVEEDSGAVWVSEDDSRVTRVGKFLRRTRLDEFPQFINVFKGEMSLVGPRPERGEFITQFLEKNGVYEKEKAKDERMEQEIPYYSIRILVKPGITGWAQINYGYADSYESSKDKLEYDLYYVLNRSFFLDLGILLKTVKIVFLGRGK